MNNTSGSRFQSLNEYLNQELADVLSIPKEQLLFKSKPKTSGILLLLSGILLIVLGIFQIYAGLTHREFVYGFGIYILTGDYRDWAAVIIGIIMILASAPIFLFYVNYRRFRLRIYPTRIKGYALFNNSLIAMPCEIPTKNIESFSSKPGFLVVKANQTTYYFRSKRIKKALRMLGFIREVYASLPI